MELLVDTYRCRCLVFTIYVKHTRMVATPVRYILLHNFLMELKFHSYFVQFQEIKDDFHQIFSIFSTNCFPKSISRIISLDRYLEHASCPLTIQPEDLFFQAREPP
jgi:hypothetical protein